MYIVAMDVLFIESLYVSARNAVVVITCAIIASILVDIYGFETGGTNFLTLTGNVKEGIPLPSVPKFSINQFDHHTNTTITRTAGEIFSVITLRNYCKICL